MSTHEQQLSEGRRVKMTVDAGLDVQGMHDDALAVASAFEAFAAELRRTRVICEHRETIEAHGGPRICVNCERVLPASDSSGGQG